MLRDYESSWKHSKIGEELGLSQAKVLLRKLREVSRKPE